MMWFLACAAALASAAQFRAELQARSAGRQQTAQDGSRPVLAVKAKATVHVRWTIAAKSPAQDVTVHAYVVKEGKIGEAPPVKLGSGVVYESALIMDFEPNATSSGNFDMQAPVAGSYLLRVETLGVPPGQAGSAAIDLKVE